MKHTGSCWSSAMHNEGPIPECSLTETCSRIFPPRKPSDKHVISGRIHCSDPPTPPTPPPNGPLFPSQGLFYTPKHDQEEFEELPRGSFRAVPDEGGEGGGVVEIGPASDETVVRITLDAAGVVRRLHVIPAAGETGRGEPARQSLTDLLGAQELSGSRATSGVEGGRGSEQPTPGDVEAQVLYPAKHYVVGRGEMEMENVMFAIKDEMEERCSQLGREGKVLEAERLRQRTENDLLLLDAVGTCKVDAAACPAVFFLLSLRSLVFRCAPPRRLRRSFFLALSTGTIPESLDH